MNVVILIALGVTLMGAAVIGAYYLGYRHAEIDLDGDYGKQYWHGFWEGCRMQERLVEMEKEAEDDA